jgi:hypothetical protein
VTILKLDATGIEKCIDVNNRMINECGVVGEIRFGRGNRSIRRKPAIVPFALS